MFYLKYQKKPKETEEDVLKRVQVKLNSDEFKAEVKAMVHRWNSKRIKLGLVPFK